MPSPPRVDRDVIGPDGARVEFEGSMASARRVQADVVVAHAGAALAPLAAQAGDHDRAEILADEGIEAARGLGLRQILIMALTRGAEAAVLGGRYHRAAQLLRESLLLVRDSGGQAWVADSLEMAAVVRGACADPGSAVRLLGACEALRQALGEKTAGGRLLHGEVQRCQTAATQGFLPDDFAKEWAKGQEMPADEAMAYALAMLTPEILPWT